jgi:hypothetical protein
MRPLTENDAPYKNSATSLPHHGGIWQNGKRRRVAIVCKTDELTGTPVVSSGSVDSARETSFQIESRTVSTLGKPLELVDCQAKDFGCRCWLVRV